MQCIFPGFSARLVDQPMITDKESNLPLGSTNTEVITLFGVPECMKGGYVSYNYTDDGPIIYNTGELKVGRGLYNSSQYCLVQIENPKNTPYWYQANVCISATPTVIGNGGSDKHQVDLLQFGILAFILSYAPMEFK